MHIQKPQNEHDERGKEHGQHERPPQLWGMQNHARTENSLHWAIYVSSELPTRMRHKPRSTHRDKCRWEEKERDYRNSPHGSAILLRRSSKGDTSLSITLSDESTHLEDERLGVPETFTGGDGTYHVKLYLDAFAHYL